MQQPNSLKPQRNLTMLMDFYELTMGNGYLAGGIGDKTAVFDMFFRKIPENGGFCIFAGLEQLAQYLENLRFTDEDIEFLRSKKIFDDRFLSYLKNFTFECDVWAFREGTPMFPGEPIVIVRGPVVQAQMVETMILLTINHQSLIATKANRIVRAAQGRDVIEFGSRRAQSYDAAIYGARAAYIGGCAATACTILERDHGVPVVGTMAHSWVQMFGSEYEAFARYAKLYPDNCTLLVDTYNTSRSGVPNAIRVFDEVLAPMGKRPKAIRIDSGDIAYLSKKARGMLDGAGYPDVKIIASNSLDEYIIRDLLIQGAAVDAFGVGEKMITSKAEPVMGGVYKLAAVQGKGGGYIPKIKISETIEKITNPGFKSAYRFFSRESGKAIADYITVYGEEINPENPVTLFDPNATWKKQTVQNFDMRRLLTPVFVKGRRVYEPTPLTQVQKFCADEIAGLWDEVKRFEHPHRYYVDLSQKLWDIKQGMLTGGAGQD
ncbi:MAG: nicotinate phosphoribosyltransferase [Oscillospiraceae bacterium]|nr:nicotinate phosphoribosyltransferase [Oscillospiraceae bacterium]